MKKRPICLLICILLVLTLVVPAGATVTQNKVNLKRTYNATIPLYLCEEPVLSVEISEHLLGHIICSNAGVCSIWAMDTRRNTGVVESTGVKYRWLDRSVGGYILNRNGQSVERSQSTILLIGQGKIENHRLHCTVQRVVNANGEITSTITECHSEDCEEGTL
jgi:hypothetical protein